MFKKYNSIDNVTNMQIERIMSNSQYDHHDFWVVNPKVDGSNMGIYFDLSENKLNDEYKLARRNDFLTENESFYGAKDVIGKYAGGLIAMKRFIVEDHPNCYHIKDLTVFGEICGGVYDDLKPERNVKPVFTRVQYSNRIEFVVFDIRLTIVFDDGEEHIQYYPFDLVVKLCEKYKIPCVPIIYKGSFIDCVNWSANHNADPDPMWEIFGMPYELPNNIREGNVIKPVIDWFIGESRVILKDKNQKFCESTKIKKEKKSSNGLPTGVLLETVDAMKAHITINRFYSVVSKIGEYTMKDFATIMRDMTEDVIEEFIKEHPETWEKELEQNEKEIRKFVTKQVSIFLVQNKKELF